MIVSLTQDEEWLESFGTLPAFALPRGPVLVVAPHPDDETLGAGALLSTLSAQGVSVRVVAVTDGENAYDTPGDERLLLARTREDEQTRALAVLGIPASSVVRLRMTDSGLHLEEQELAERLAELAEPGTTLLAPWDGDFHPDHESCARASAQVARSMGLAQISYFFWTWHRGVPSALGGLRLGRFDVTPAALAAKTAALRMHDSQLHRENGEPILPERLLQPARWPFEVFAQHV